MRLPFPERLPLFPVAIFCAILYVLQQLSGTSLLFSICTTLFILITTVAFNVAGGLTRPSGAFIFSWGLLAAIFGITYKAALGEPGQDNLLQPDRTIEVYVGSAIAMLIASYAARKLGSSRGLFPQFTSDRDMARAAIACLALGGVVQIYQTFSTASTATAGSLSSAFNHLNYFVPLAMIFGVTSEIRRSGGRRSVNITVLVAALLIFFGGIFGYSKQGMLTPFVCWLFPAAAQRYKISIVQILSVVLMLAFTTYYLVPYSQYGRNFRVEGVPFSESFKTNLYLLSNLDIVRTAQISAAESYNALDGVVRYYNHSQGLVDRLQMIAPDDAIINATENGGAYGIFPTIFYFENNIPHFIWPGKPIINFGNMYAHEVGIITDETDTTTGISFSPAGEAYHQAGWAGTFVMLPILAFGLFLVADRCYGDTRHSPFALLALISFLHEAPESGISGLVQGMTFEIGALLAVSLISVKLMPILANLIVPSKKRGTEETSANPSQYGRVTANENISDVLPDISIPTYRWSGRAPNA